MIGTYSPTGFAVLPQNETERPSGPVQERLGENSRKHDRNRDDQEEALARVARSHGDDRRFEIADQMEAEAGDGDGAKDHREDRDRREKRPLMPERDADQGELSDEARRRR